MPNKSHSFAPLRYIDGYLPIKNHGLIGDGTTAALAGGDGTITWLCVPRFDSPALFCKILDAHCGGAFTLAPDQILESRQYYLDDTGILVTEMRSPEGLLQVTDLLTLRSGADLAEGVAAARGELLRSAQVLQGTVRVRVEVEPRGGAAATKRGDGLRLRCAARPDLDLQLYTNRHLDGLRSTYQLEAGDRLHLLLNWQPGSYRYHAAFPDQKIAATGEAWQRWMAFFNYEGPQAPLVRRSAITLKLLDHFANGAIVAAPTSSLPELIGGVRNWDYRYAWIRDAAFSVYALRRIGLEHEARAFLGWVLDEVERPERPRVLYNLDGKQPQPEWKDPELEGYRQSRPVRWGNAAADQVQHDVYGEILDCAYQWAARSGEITKHLWQHLRGFVEAARREWQTPDQGIWEVRTPGRVFTYSAVLCQVALDRGARLAERLNLPGDVKGWWHDAEKIREAILEEAWDDSLSTLTEHLGGGGLDASLLSLPLRRVIPADHPKMVATTEAINKRLGAGNGLLYRYLPDESPDGLPGHEGAFLLCSFWLVDNLAKQGRMDEAMALYDSLCERAGPLGLLPEEIDPANGEFLGNYPQAFSHVGVISSGVNLARLINAKQSKK
jgi:pentatricopeptide repeat protein